MLTLSHKAQIRRFTSDLTKILKTQPGKQLSVSAIPEAFSKWTDFGGVRVGLHKLCIAGLMQQVVLIYQFVCRTILEFNFVLTIACNTCAEIHRLCNNMFEYAL